MKKTTFTLVTLLALVAALQAQTTHFFQPIVESAIPQRDGSERSIFPSKYKTYLLDYEGIKAALTKAPREFTTAAKEKKCVIHIPLADGSMEAFSVWQTAIMDEDLAAQHPYIRTFAGESLQTPGRTVRLSHTARGFRAMVLQPDLGVVYVDPYIEGNGAYCIVYDRVDLPRDERRLSTGVTPTEDAPIVATDDAPYAPTVEDRGTLLTPVKLKVFRYIAATTGQFGQDHGGTKPLVLSAVVEYTDRTNAIFERDANIRLQLAVATQNVIFLNPGDHPYSGVTVQDWMSQNPNVLNTYCNFNSHDIGHVYARYITGGAIGVAGSLGNVCGASKAAGCSAGYGGSNYGDGFISVIGQEVGHQLNGGHTWNRCNGGNGRHGNSAFEPGSGSTIMSYHGACGTDNVDGPSLLSFHSGSVEEFQLFYTQQNGSTCGSFLETTNNPPVVTLPYQNNFFIPIQTPFEVNGSATDPDGNTLTYSWEGKDTGPEVALGEQEANSAIFRVYAPGSATNRYFPRLSTILSNQTYKAELLPEYTRNVTLRLVARDNRPDGGGVGWADVAFKAWGGAGPFLVTAPNSSSDIWRVGEYVNVTWDVSNTNLAPVNCKNVNIRLSTDGGQTYPITLASGVANDGGQYVLVPNHLTAAARVRIDAADNIFFDISNANFKIQQPTEPTLTLGLSADAANICLPNTFTSEVLTAGSLGFSNSVSIELTGDLPPGATATFSKTTLNPGESSTLQIDLQNVTQEGTYTFNVQASAAGSPVLVRPITLRLISNDFSALSLASPADGLTNALLAQTLNWNTTPDAESYDVQFSDTPSFSTILASQTATTLPSFAIPFLLEKGKAYYWRVRPRNECGIHDWTEPFFFSTFPENCSVFAANDLPKSIASNGTPTVESKITVNAGGTVSDVNVRQIKGFHGFFKDLDVTLISPQGTQVVLFSQKCGNYNGYFNFGLDDDAPGQFPCPPANNGLYYRPENPLAPLYGQNNTGIWTLRVKDNVVTGGGTLEIFKLEFCTSVSVSPPYLVNNHPLLLPQGTNKLITPDLLLVDDADNTPAELLYTLLTVPQFGLLDKIGFGNLQPGHQFTQAELNAGLLRFFDYGTNTGGTDGFRFMVTDGQGGFFGTPKFTIQPFNPVSTQEPSGTLLSFSLFPNPTSDAVWLTLDRPATSEMWVGLFSAAGQLLQTTNLPHGTERLQVRVGSLPKGIYLVRVEGAMGTGVRKLVVE
ncbi:MAG: proprotein convertase P-domain-containing protein [Saprospiraceae bacterium]|nr:proprotein convertase P-domain-containing protein [Saprospiraceae bacterium]